MNEMCTEFANFGSNICKQPAETWVFNVFIEKMAGVTDPPHNAHAIDFIDFVKIVCNQTLSMKTHECPRICKPRGKLRDVFQIAFRGLCFHHSSFNTLRFLLFALRAFPMKLSRTGYETGASEPPFITQVDGTFLNLYGKTPNDVLQRHRNALAGVEDDEATPKMKRGNYMQDGALQWWNDEFGTKVVEPKVGYRNEYCNMVASLDGVFTEDWQHGNYLIPAASVWECKIPGWPAQRTDSLERVLQVQAQMDCTNTEWGVIAELAMSDCIWRVAIVQRHEPTIKAIRRSVDVFWQHMKDGTDYGPQTSSEASRMLLGDRFPERMDLTQSPTTEIMSEARQHLIDASETYLTARRTKASCERMMEETAFVMKTMMNNVERVRLPGNISLNHTTTDDQKPRRFSVNEAKQ